MSEKMRTSLLSLAIIIVMVFSAVSPETAYADDGTPPEQTPTQVTEGESTEGATETQPTEEAATTEPTLDPQTAVEATPVAAEGAATEAAPDSQPAAETTPAEGEPIPDPSTAILSDVPENTGVTVLDPNGNVQPLVTQEAAEAIVTSDPIWCPGSQVPTPGQNGCTQSFSSFDDLLTHLSGNPAYQGAGTIYIQQGAYAGDDPNKVIDFNSTSYDLSNIRNSDLTVTGGWNTSSTEVDPAKPSAFKDYSLLIGSSTSPWGGSLVVNNISMNLTGVTDPQVNGITIYSQGNITLSNVSVVMAPNNGAELHADGDVNIEKSYFARNDKAGTVIRAKGNVNIANSDFSNATRRRRQNIGLDIVSGEATSLFAVLSNNNREVGTNIESTGRVTIANSVFSSQKDRFNSPNGMVFLGYGLKVVTPDSIDILGVTANDNFLWGASLDAGGDIAIADSVFNLNSTDEPGFIDDTGLFITRGNNVALSNVTANDNRLFGAQINVNGTVSINDSNFNNNRGIITTNGVPAYHGHGLHITTLADIFIDNTNATGNMLFGGQLNAGGEVAISDSNFSNTSTTLATVVLGKGLEIASTGNSSLLNVVVSNNQTVGADIQAGGDIFLDNVTATDNGTDGVVSQGACTRLNGGLYSGNDQYGLNLGSSALSIVSPGIFNNNTAGNIFPATPPNCASATTVSTPSVANNLPALSVGTLPVTASAESFNLFSSEYVSNNTGTESSPENVSLNSVLANTRTGNANSHGIFFGKYVYIHSLAGLQIFAYNLIADQSLAMGG